jgi:small-conductance mechanosensitive channel
VKINDAYGEVVRIGLQTTQIVTPGDTKVTIPNATALNTMSWNANSGVPDAQVQTDVFLPATADPEAALAIGRQVATTCPYTLLTKPYFVLLVDSFTEAPFLILRIKAYVYDHRYEPAMMGDITRRAKRELARAGLLRW